MVFKELVRSVLSDETLKEVCRLYPFRITPHLANIIREKDDPLWRQFVPDALELSKDGGFEDPLGEEKLSPLPGLVHRYPDRVLWLVTSRCAAFCRFCTRKRIWRKGVDLSEETVKSVEAYISRDTRIKDVIISGGDPLILKDEILEDLLDRLYGIDHIMVVRIGTRLPITFPQAFKKSKMAILSKRKPLYMNVHINHPEELTAESLTVINELIERGVVINSQTVLLKGINDNAETLRELFLTLLHHRVRPYYLLQMDLVEGSSHFRTPLSRGLTLLKQLRHTLSGLAMPHFMVDLPQGGGKIELVPSAIEAIEEDRILFRNRLGTLSAYPLEKGEKGEIASLRTSF